MGAAVWFQGCESTSVVAEPQQLSDIKSVETPPDVAPSVFTHSIVVEHVPAVLGVQAIFSNATVDLPAGKDASLRYMAQELEIGSDGKPRLVQKPLPAGATEVVLGETQDIIRFNRNTLLEEHHIISILVVDVFEQVLPVSITQETSVEVHIQLEDKESLTQVFLEAKAQEEIIITSAKQLIVSSQENNIQAFFEDLTAPIQILLEHLPDIIEELVEDLVEDFPDDIEIRIPPLPRPFPQFPRVLRVNSSLPDGVYGTGRVVPVEVVFTKPVTVIGVPTLTLGVAPLDRVVMYHSGSGSDTLVFLYTVMAGDHHEDLDYTGPGALALNGGSIQDDVGLPADLLLPVPGAPGSLAFFKDIKIETTPPHVIAVEGMTPAGLYGVGRSISIRVVFDEPIGVTLTEGSPILLLETGVVDHAALLESFETNALNFTYQVQSGDESIALDYASRSALELLGAQIKDVAGNPADLTLPEVGASALAQQGIGIDGVAPQGLRVTSHLANGAYRAGQIIPIEVIFSETVLVSGLPQLHLSVGGPERYAFYVSGDQSDHLTFHYEVQEGDNTEDLDYLGVNALEVLDGHIEDRAGNWAILTLPEPGAVDSLSANKDLIIDTRAPQVVRVFSTSENKLYGIGGQIGIIVHFDEAMYFTGDETPSLLLALVGMTKSLSAQVPSNGSSDGFFNYHVAEGDTTAGASLDYVDRHALALSAESSWVDRAGNSAILLLSDPGTLASLSGTNQIRIDGIRPRVDRVIASQPSGIYKVGQSLGIHVVFDEPISLSAGSELPTLELALGYRNGNRAVSCGGEDDTLPPEDTLVCTYLIEPKDMNADLDYTGIDALQLADSRIVDAAGNDAVIRLPDLDSGRSLVASGIDVDSMPAFDRELLTTADDERQDGAHFGESADISSHGDRHWAIVGAPDQLVNRPRHQDLIPTSKAGAAFIYGHDGEAWDPNYQVQLVVPNIDDIREDSFFGSSVAIDAATQKAVVGMPGPAGNLGKAFVYAWDGASWNYEAQLRVTPDNDNWLSSGAEFGASVDIFGDLVIVGAPKHVMPTESGRAYVFENTHDGVWEYRATLSSGAEKDWGDRFGTSVAIAKVGDMSVAFVGSPWRDRIKYDKYYGDNRGAVYVFATSDVQVWPEYVVRLEGQAQSGDYFGRDVSLSVAGDEFVAAVGAHLSNEYRHNAVGSAYIFRSGDGLSWEQEARLTIAQEDAIRGSLFGQTLSIDGDRLIIGAKQHGADALGYLTHTGAAYIFRLKRGAWSLHTQLITGAAAHSDHFGSDVAISEDMAVVGTPDADAPPRLDSGYISIFE